LQFGAAFQPWILKNERSGLQTRIGATESVSLRADEKLIAFIELESAIRGSAFALTIWRRFITLGTDTKA
jgi:hypothetical protein